MVINYFILLLLGIIVLLLPLQKIDLPFYAIAQEQKYKIALVMPTFTGAGYNNAFYKFYDTYGQVWGKPVSTDLQYLTAKITYKPPIDKPTTYAWIKPLQSHLRGFLPNATISVIEDRDIHNGAIFETSERNLYDVLIFGHEEYSTKKMYDNIKKFVFQGGAAIFLDGNIFYAEVHYSSENQTVTLVNGHSWKYNGIQASRSVNERWENETREWLGSNYYEGYNAEWKSKNGTYLYEYKNDPFKYGDVRKCCVTLEEDQYITNPKVHVILDYELTDPNHKVATYWKPYGEGRVIVLGLYSELLVEKANFLNFFDQLLMKYVLNSLQKVPEFPILTPAIIVTIGFAVILKYIERLLGWKKS